MPVARPIRITPLTSVLGARVEGVSLAEPISQAALESIHAALLEHLVLVFPAQKLDGEQRHRFAFRLGRPEPHLDQLAAHGAWHTDYTFHAEIPTFATLRAEFVPPVGGDTLRASTIAARDVLSPRMQAWLADLRAVHWHGPHFARNFGIDRQGPQAVRRFEAAFPAREHPVGSEAPRAA